MRIPGDLVYRKDGMRFTRVNLVVIAVAAGLGLAGLVHTCDRRLAAVSSSRAPASLPSALSLPPSPKRVAVFSAAVVEMFFDLGLGDRIAGVTRFAVFPEAAKRLPDLGGVMDVSFERLSGLEPDLIIAQSSSEKLRKFAANRNIPFQRMEIENVEDVYLTLKTLGEQFGREPEAGILIHRIQKELADVRQAVRSRKPVRCFVSVDRGRGNLSSLLSVGREGFLPELLAVAGGKNIFDDLETRYPVVSKEALVARAPEVILEIKPGLDRDAETHASFIGDWNRFDALAAAKEGRVRIIGHDGGLLPGPRMAETARAIAEALHPDAFGKEEPRK